MADTSPQHALHVGDMDSIFGQVKAIVLAALESASDGSINPVEAIRLAGMGVALVQAIVAMVIRNHSGAQKDSLQFVAANSQVHLPD